jgi:hypothetical protein
MHPMILVFSLCLLFACHGAKTPAKKETAVVVEATENQYRFGVSFYSIGSGIDVKAKKLFLDFIRDFETGRGLRLSVEEVRWGREGEVDYCFRLAELTAPDQEKFIADIRSLLQPSKWVRFSENSPCRERRVRSEGEKKE